MILLRFCLPFPLFYDFQGHVPVFPALKKSIVFWKPEHMLFLKSYICLRHKTKDDCIGHLFFTPDI